MALRSSHSASCSSTVTRRRPCRALYHFTDDTLGMYIPTYMRTRHTSGSCPGCCPIWSPPRQPWISIAIPDWEKPGWGAESRAVFPSKRRVDNDPPPKIHPIHVNSSTSPLNAFEHRTSFMPVHRLVPFQSLELLSLFYRTKKRVHKLVTDRTIR